MIIKRFILSVFFALLVTSGVSFADDTELYVTESSIQTGTPPKVLIIFDNSGSMSLIEQDAPGAYNPDDEYEPISSAHAYQDDKIYFTKGVGIDNAGEDIPLSPSDSKRFLNEINGCASSWTALEDYGRYTGLVGEFITRGKSGTWSELRDNSGANFDVIDCVEDVIAKDDRNKKNSDGVPFLNGYPINGDADEPYSELSEGKALASVKSVTLYTAKYLRWHAAAVAGVLPTTPQSRLEIAKEAITSVVSTTRSFNYGLAVFNLNYDGEGNRDGGRIIAGIKKRNSSEFENFLTTINDLPAETNTPLCETLFEAYRYFAGKPVVFGKKDSDYQFWDKSWYRANSPARDISIESGTGANTVYESPFRTCPDIAYVIYITDGTPTLDNYSDDDIKALLATGVKAKVDDDIKVDPDYSPVSLTYTRDGETVTEDNYLAALASYMYQNDLITSPDGNGEEHRQTVKTFTIGFSEGASDAAPLLQAVAERSESTYFVAKTGLNLEKALNEALLSILETDTSFTSPSIASNNFDRTQTFDSAYYAMFRPEKGPRWSGNLKKIKVTSGGSLVDKNDAPAIGDEGSIKSTACTYWSSCVDDGKPMPDGNSVLQGGAAEALGTGISERKIYTNISGIGLLELEPLAKVATDMEIDEADVAGTIKWLTGYDVDQDTYTANDPRDDIMGDPLHSKPLAINLGTKASPDIRIILGTNQGLVHMFKDEGDSVKETWAFIPQELLHNVPTLRSNEAIGGHSVYGMDSPPVSYVETDGDKVAKALVFMGMRRGGDSYYAFDLLESSGTPATEPQLLWTINSSTAGFEEMGQSWSEPVVTTIPGHSGPVLIFGGGYDVRYDDTDPLNAKGASVYIVDAQTGNLLHSFSGSSSSDTVVSGLTDSIVSSVAVLDSNNDGDSDRIYASDVGGNIWRFDLPTPLGESNKWTAFKFADLAGALSPSRRFFAEPSIAQTTFTNISQIKNETDNTTVTASQNVPYDAVVIGSGNRPRPSGKERQDMFFALQDRNVVTQAFGGEGNQPTPQALTLSNLYNVSSSAPASEAENIAFGENRGWYYDYTSPGEKTLTGALIIDGKVYFTSFVPAMVGVSELVCNATGQGRLYVFDLHKGTRTYSSIYYELGERVPDTPQIVIPVPEENEEPYIYIIGIGKGELDGNGEFTGTINVGSGLGVNKIYYNIEE
jgi:type IV pilus assembly protein PilY1